MSFVIDFIFINNSFMIFLIPHYFYYLFLGSFLSLPNYCFYSMKEKCEPKIKQFLYILNHFRTDN